MQHTNTLHDQAAQTGVPAALFGTRAALFHLWTQIDRAARPAPAPSPAPMAKATAGYAMASPLGQPGSRISPPAFPARALSRTDTFVFA